MVAGSLLEATAKKFTSALGPNLRRMQLDLYQDIGMVNSMSIGRRYSLPNHRAFPVPTTSVYSIKLFIAITGKGPGPSR